MRRLHLLEIAEQPWCPRAVRDGVTDYLQFMGDAGKVYAAAAPLLAAAIDRGARADVVDLGAGGGGPWRSLLPLLRERGVAPRVRLTDRHPNREAFARIAQASDGAITGDPRPIDAADVPPDLPGTRTIFSALHHFRPDGVRAVLGHAAARGVPVAAFEATRRSVEALLLTALAPLFVLLVTPALRPVRWSRLFWTYVVPAIPLVVLFDGLVSCLRTYTPDELRALTAGIGADGYTWQVGETGDGPIPVTFVIGTPPPRVASS